MEQRSSWQLSPGLPERTPQEFGVVAADQSTGLLKAQVAGSIVATLRNRHLMARAAAAAAGVDPADVPRIRNGDLARFTLNRLIPIAHRLGYRIEVAVLPQGRAG